jgi:hypothetical protein
MGLRSPQELPKVNIQRRGSVRTSGTSTGQIDKSFLDTAAKGINAQQEAERKRQAEQLEYVKTVAHNDAEADVIMANAELSQAQGLNALDKAPDLRAKLQRGFEKRKQNIPSQYHPYVEQIYANKLNRFNKFAIPYTLGQVNKVKDEADKTFVANSMNEAIEESGNLQDFNDVSLAKVTYAITKRAQKQYGNQQELIDHAVTLGVSETIRRSIVQQATVGAFDKAGQLFSEFNAELTPADRERAIKLMNSQRAEHADTFAQSLASQAMVEAAGDIEKAEMWLRGAAPDGRIYKSAAAMLQMRDRVAKTAEKRKIEDTHAKINRAIEQGQNPEMIIKELPPGEERDKAYDYYNSTRGGQNRITDFNAVDELTDRLANAVSARDLPDTLIDAYRHRISPKDMKPLESWYNRLRGQDTAEYARTNKLSDGLVNDTFENFAKANGVRGKDRGRLRLAVQDEVERVLSANPKVTSRELKSKILNTLRDRAVKQVPTGKRWWNVFTPDSRREVQDNLRDDTSPVVDRSWYDAIRRSDNTLTESQINATIDELIKSGANVSVPR